MNEIERLLNNPSELYHLWYYNRNIWRGITFMGVYAAKNVMDLWNYQEIIWNLKPALIVEFGTYQGGSALYLATMLQKIWQTQLKGPDGMDAPLPIVLTVDNGQAGAIVDDLVRDDPHIVVFTGDTTSVETEFQILKYRRRSPDPAFFILDSDHSKDHVLKELEMLRGVTRPGDYVVVEDSNINGHPVLPDFGPGPWEAIEEYERRHPDDYRHDTEREQKFGWTFAPRGYLIRI